MLGALDLPFKRVLLSTSTYGRRSQLLRHSGIPCTRSYGLRFPLARAIGFCHHACSVCHLRKHWCINASITCCYFLESLQRMSSYLCYVGILISLHSTLGSCATKPLTWCSDRVIFVSFVSWVPYKSLYPSIVVAKCMRPLWMRTVFSRVAFWVSVSSA